MRLRFCVSRCSPILVVVGAALLMSVSPLASSVDVEQSKKPSIVLKANPPVGFTPLRVVLTAELRGGANDYEEFYCASVEWDWGDGTKSENRVDCDPYEPGKSEIKRRYVQDHMFRAMTTDLSQPGANGPVQYRIKFTLKQKNKTVGSGSTTIEIRSGVGG